MRVSFSEIVRVLSAHKVEFVVVGGVSAALQGAPLNTFVLDIVHFRSSENVDRLLTALNELDAVYRVQPDKKVRPGKPHLSGEGHQLLLTRYGPLDILGAIGNSRDYMGLLPHTTVMSINDAEVRVLNLEVLIATKEEAGGEKDLAALGLLRRVLREKG